MELRSTLCGSLDRREFGGGWVYVQLRPSAETLLTLIVNVISIVNQLYTSTK